MYLVFALLVALSSLQEIPTEKKSYTIMYFFNPDCPACAEVAPFLEYLKEEYEAVIYSYNMRNPVGFRYGVQNQIRYVPTMIIHIEREDETVVERYEGVDQIKEAESQIARLTGYLTVSDD